MGILCLERARRVCNGLYGAGGVYPALRYICAALRGAGLVKIRGLAMGARDIAGGIVESNTLYKDRI